MKTAFVLIIMAIVMAWNFSYANDKHMTNMSKEDRQKMADMHMKMADCLKSDKPMKDCKAEMKKECKSMGKECPMMGHKWDHDKDSKEE